MLLLALLLTTVLKADPNTVSILKKEIAGGFSPLDYEQSLVLLAEFLENDNTAASDKYEVYVLKANLYKKLFRYEHALYYLDKALAEGMKGADTFAVKQRITAERALIYFDKQDFKRSIRLMKVLEENNYKTLDKKYVIFLYTQKAYFLMKDGEFAEAENLLNTALNMGLKQFPNELPIVFGKQIELYHLTGAYDKRNLVYKEALGYVRKTNNIKYEFYLEEVMKNVFSSTNDYENAFVHQKKCDSLFALYDSNSKSSNLELKDMQLRNQHYEEDLKTKENLLTIFAFFTSILTVFAGILLKLYHHSKKQNLQIEKENKRILEKKADLEKHKKNG